MNNEDWIKNLFMSHEGRLLRYASRTLNKEVSQEIVQEVFLRLIKESPEKLRDRESEWLFCVCRNLINDHLKKYSHKNEKSGEELEGVSQQMTPEEKLDAHQQNNQIQNLMLSLSKEKQEVLKLKFQEGFSYKEISNITGHSVSYVGVIIHESMQFLKSELSILQTHKPGGAR